MHQLTELFNDSPVVYIELPDEPLHLRHWFRATEVCKALGFANAFRDVKVYCKEHQYREFTVGKGRPALYLSESGVYRLLLRSKAPVAVEFQDWLTEELLPKLRSQELYALRDSGESLEEYRDREAALIETDKRLKAERALGFNEGKQAAAALLPQPERVTNPERHIISKKN